MKKTSLRTTRGLEFKETDPGKLLAVHVPSARQFTISARVAQLLQQLNTPATEETIREEYLSGFSVEQVSQLLKYLKTTELLIPDNEEVAYQVRRPTHPLYGFEEVAVQQIEPGWYVMIGLPFGYGNADDPRCWLFPAHLRTYLKSRNVELRSPHTNFQFLGNPADFETLHQTIEQKRIKDLGDLYIGTHEFPAVVYEKMVHLAVDVFERKAIPVFIGGDHSVTYPILKAAGSVYREVQVIQFDAHTDTYSDQAEQSTHNHGNFMSEVLKMDHVTSVVQLGIRGLSNLMMRSTRKQSIFWADELRQMLRTGQLPNINPDLPTYITFDIDILDPAQAPATATPVFNGLQYAEIQELLKGILTPLNIIGMDLVEVNPKLDRENRTMELSSHLLLLMLNYAEK